MTLDDFVKFCEKEHADSELAWEILAADEQGLTLEEYRQKKAMLCPKCEREPIAEGKSECLNCYHFDNQTE